MKKTIVKLLIIVCLSLGIVYGVFYAKRLSTWKNFIDEYQASETKQFIHENGLIALYKDDAELKELPLVKNGDIDLSLVKEDNELLKKITNDLTDIIKKSNKKPQTKIANEELIKYGFVNDDNDSYMYLYENGTVLIFKDGNYYVYSINSLGEINKAFDNADTGNTDIDPYFLLKQ